MVAQRSAGRSFAEVQAEAREIHEAVIAEFKSRPFKSLMAPRFPEDPDERPLMLWVAGDTYGHYGEHAQYIRAILG